MAEIVTLASPRPSRTQIDKVFGQDPDFARKVEKIFDDLINAANAANANARMLDEVRIDVDSSAALARAMMIMVKRTADLAESVELQANALSRLNARITRVERAISDLQQEPLP